MMAQRGEVRVLAQEIVMSAWEHAEGGCETFPCELVRTDADGKSRLALNGLELQSTAEGLLAARVIALEEESERLRRRVEEFASRNGAAGEAASR